MKKLSLGLVLGIASLLPFGSASALPLTTLGFETPVAGAGTILYNPLTTDWVYTGLAGLSGNASPMTFGNPVAPEGVQVAFLQSATGFTAGSISQVFTTSLNATMGFTFAAAQRAQGGTAGPNVQSINVLLDSIVIGAFTPTGFTYLDYATSLISVLAGTHTLTFTGMNSVGDNTAFIDNLRVTSNSVISVVPVSVPGTMLLLLGGVGLLAYRARRTTSVFGV